MWCLWWLALAALGAGAQAHGPRPVCAHDLQGLERCFAQGNEEDSYKFVVMSEKITFEFVDGNYFGLDCGWHIALDEPALPRFEPALRVREVRLNRCWPRAGSYAAALRALNVTALEEPGPGGDSAAPTYSMYLELNDVKNFNASVLGDTTTLRNLIIYYTSVTAADLARLPVSLERLELRYTKTGRVSAAALARLPRLSMLNIVDTNPVEVEAHAASNLKSLVLVSPAPTVSLALPDTLNSVSLTDWAERHPEPWRSCAGLDELLVSNTAVEALPDGWLARCEQLRSLAIQFARNLKTLTVGALRGATALENLQVIGSALEALPTGLLDEAPALRVLDLQDNRLHTLPGNLFRRSISLVELDLSSNSLSGSVMGVLGTIKSLSVLRLSDNIALDPCPSARDPGHDEQGLLPLRDLKNLTELSLDGTGTQRVCTDWRQLPRLKSLDLTDTDVTKLNYTDLEFNTTVDITVQVPYVDLGVSREDYKRLAAAPPGPTLTLKMMGLLRCDCELYWAAAALRHPNARLRETGGYCTSGRALRDVPLDKLVCPA